jgi:hypothetical protein
VIHKLINSIWNREELPDQWKELNILLSRLSPYTEKIIDNHQCRFQRNKSTTDKIFCIHKVLEKKWENNETVHQLFIDFREEGNTVQYSHRVWCTHEISQAD